MGDGGAGGKCLFGRGTALENQRRDGADPIQRRGELLIRDGVHANADVLSQLQFAAVHFFQLEVHIHFGEVGDFRDFGAGPGIVALLKRRRGLAERTLRAEVRQHVDDTVVGRAQLHHAKIVLHHFQVAHGLVLALVEAAEIGVVTHLVRVDRCLHCLQRALRHAHLYPVLLAVDGRKHLGFAGVEFGAFHIVLARHLAHGVGFVVHRLRGLGLLDIAIGRAHHGGLRDHVLVLLRAVELHDNFALLDGAAGIGQAHDPQSRHLRRFQDHGTGTLDVAAGAHADDELPATHAGHGYFDFRGPGVSVRRDNAAAAQRQTHHPGDDLHSARVRFAQPLAGSLILRCHFCFLC